MTTDIQTPAGRIHPHLIYRADFLISASMGLLLLLTADWLTALVGWPLPPAFLTALGTFLFAPWSVFNLWIGLVGRRAGVAIQFNMAGDAGWMVGTVVLLALYAEQMSAIGIALLIGQGLSVTAVLITKLMGFRQLVA